MDPKARDELARMIEWASDEFARRSAKINTPVQGQMARAIAEHVSAQVQLFAGLLRNALLEGA